MPCYDAHCNFDLRFNALLSQCWQCWHIRRGQFKPFVEVYCQNSITFKTCKRTSLVAESVTDQDGQQGRHDTGGAWGQGAGGVLHRFELLRQECLFTFFLHRAPQGPHWLCQEQHSSFDQLQVKKLVFELKVNGSPWNSQEQQEAFGKSEGVRPSLQHGVGGSQRDVDWAAKDWKG